MGFSDLIDTSYNTNDAYRQGCIYYQIAVAIELVVLSTRTNGFFFLSAPSWQLSVSIIVGLIVITILVVFGWLTEEISLTDIGLIWAYDLIWFVAIDAAKVILFSTSSPGHSFGKGFRFPHLLDIMEVDVLEKTPLLPSPTTPIITHHKDIRLVPETPANLAMGSHNRRMSR